MARLDRKVAIITGAASGIGAHCALRFAQEGAGVAGLDLQKPVDAVAWAAVEAAAPDALFLDGVDVRDEERVAAAVRAAVERFRRIDVLVNAAGVEGIGPAHELTQESWDRTVDINLKGSFLVAKHVLPSMLAQRAGSVIHVASVEGLEGMAGSMAYNASKGGVVLMTKSMARLRPGGHPCELPLPRVDPHAADEHRAAGQAGARPDGELACARPCRPSGRGRGGGALPRLRRCLLRDRTRAGRRRGLDGGATHPARVSWRLNRPQSP